jgi:hypothetical protein
MYQDTDKRTVPSVDSNVIANELRRILISANLSVGKLYTVLSATIDIVAILGISFHFDILVPEENSNFDEESRALVHEPSLMLCFTLWPSKFYTVSSWKQEMKVAREQYTWPAISDGKRSLPHLELLRLSQV